MDVRAYMISCAERDEVREQTIANLGATDWRGALHVEMDSSTAERRQDRQEATARRALEQAIADGVEFALFLEDDLDFNLHLLHNLERWQPLQGLAGPHFFGSLYNPNVRMLAVDAGRATSVADPEAVYGSQAMLLSRETVAHVLAGWAEVPGMQDIKISRLAARVCSLHYYLPSLVQHVGTTSVWGGHFHWTMDFDKHWRA